MPEDQYIGVALAVCGSFLIGSSYVTTKIGLRDARERNGFKGDGFEYFKNPLWWTGMIMVRIRILPLLISHIEREPSCLRHLFRAQIISVAHRHVLEVGSSNNIVNSY